MTVKFADYDKISLCGDISRMLISCNPWDPSPTTVLKTQVKVPSQPEVTHQTPAPGRTFLAEQLICINGSVVYYMHAWFEFLEDRFGILIVADDAVALVGSDRPLPPIPRGLFFAEAREGSWNLKGG